MALSSKKKLHGQKGKTIAWIKEHIHYCDKNNCLLWPHGKDSLGYGRAKSPDHKTRLAHRIMCEMVHGAPPNKSSLAIHTCGKGHEGCVNPMHLKWGTIRENSDDKKRHGTLLFGEAIAISKLSRNQIVIIRKMRKEGIGVIKIANIMGVARDTIYKVLDGTTWKHVE